MEIYLAIPNCTWCEMRHHLMNTIFFLSGAPGFNGSPGGTGAPGGPGSPGNPGTPGFPGAKGEPGNPGSPGFNGGPGQTGSPGSPGGPGNPGTPGFPGAKGEPGNPGSPGANGRPGGPGFPGKSATIMSTWLGYSAMMLQRKLHLPGAMRIIELLYIKSPQSMFNESFSFQFRNAWNSTMKWLRYV